MVRILVLGLCMVLSPAAPALAGESRTGGQVAAPRSADGTEQTARADSTGAEKQETAAVGRDEQTAPSREADEDRGSEAKEMSGMSIVGNDEAPKSLYIVPWKSSELGVQTSLDTTLNEGDVPVDRDVFERQLEFYRISTGK